MFFFPATRPNGSRKSCNRGTSGPRESFRGENQTLMKTPRATTRGDAHTRSCRSRSANGMPARETARLAWITTARHGIGACAGSPAASTLFTRPKERASRSVAVCSIASRCGGCEDIVDRREIRSIQQTVGPRQPKLFGSNRTFCSRHHSRNRWASANSGGTALMVRYPLRGSPEAVLNPPQRSKRSARTK